MFDEVLKDMNDFRDELRRIDRYSLSVYERIPHPISLGLFSIDSLDIRTKLLNFFEESKTHYLKVYPQLLFRFLGGN